MREVDGISESDTGPFDENALRLAAIVESCDDAIVGKLLDGTITSWNQAAEDLFGYTAEEIVGRSILTLIPEDRHHEETEIIEKLHRGERIRHFETVRCRKDGSLVPISVTISPIRLPDGTIVGASKIARDISARKRTERILTEQANRLAILQRVSASINADLDLERILQTVTDEATALSGARIGAFFYNHVAQDGETRTLYTLSGAPREAFENFGMPGRTAIFTATFENAQVIRSADIRQDPRYGKSEPHKGMPEGHLPVVSYLAVPVRSSSGEVAGGLFFGHDEPDIFSAETESLIAGIAAQAAIAIDNARLHEAAKNELARRKEAEEAKDLLLHELKHRIKNTMAMIQALVSQTLRDGPSEEREALLQRMQALSAAHDLLTVSDWKSVSLQALTDRALKPFRDGGADRIVAGGPEVWLSSTQALALTLSLHELSTNAVKYGALSTRGGRVTLDWEFPDPEDETHLRLCWSESGGPAVEPPTRRGFGTRMIESALRGKHGSAQFDYRPEGLQVTLDMELLHGGSEPAGEE